MSNKVLMRMVSIFTTAALLAAMFGLSIPAKAESGSTIEYSFSGSNAADAGYAEGKITFTSTSSGTYDLYWADDEKALDGYYSIATLKVSAGESKTVKMGYHTAIPANATKIIATKSSKSVGSAEAVYSLPVSKQLASGSGDFLYSFNSYSDVHIDKKGFYKKAKEHLAEAFRFAYDKNADFIVSSGDMVTNKAGPDDEWETYETILSSSPYTKPVWESNGNHDMRCGVESGIKSFIRATGTDSTKANIDKNKPYYYVIEEKTGDLFIFMALESESNPSKYNEFSDEQLEWVTNLLETYYYSGVNVYLIEHSPIKGFGAGDRMDKPYYSAMLSEKFSSTVEFKKLLVKYKNMVFMSGHTHEDFAMNNNYFNDGGKACHMIHNPAVAGSTMPNKDDDALDYNEGYGYNSQGYYVEAYQNRIIYYGANLTDELIYPQYSYIMEGSRNNPAVNTTTDEIPLSGVSVSASDKLNEAKDILSGYYKYASYDQYQALKDCYARYKKESTVDRNVVAKFDELITALKVIAGKADAPDVYKVGSKYYFENTKSWSKVYAYAWTGSTKNASWPGVEIKSAGTSNGKDIYCIEFNSNGQYKNLIFSDGTHQTVDIALGQYANNAFRINGKNSEGKYTVENFSFGHDITTDTDTHTDTDTDTHSDSDTDIVPIVTDETYALLYYIEGEHAWSTVDTWLVPNDDGTYRYSYNATDDCKISFSVYDKKKKVYKSLPESLIVYYSEGETFESDITSRSLRGSSLTVKELSKDNSVNIVYDPSAEKISATCETLKVESATILWKNYDGVTLEAYDNVPFGTMPTYDGEEPTRPSDAQYTYTFTGWDPAVTEVNGDALYTATYEQQVNTYTVNWVSANGTLLETDENVPYGTIPTYDGAEPQYDGEPVTGNSEYSFLGWAPDDAQGSGWSPITAVTGDVTYRAVYEVNYIPDTDTVTDTDTETDSATDTEPDTNTDTNTDTETDSATDTETDTNTDTETDTATDTESDTETDTSTDIKPEPNTDTETDTDPKPEPEPEPEPKPDPKPEPEPEPDPNTNILPSLLGDADFDDTITSADALIVLRMSAGLQPYSDAFVRFVDADGDGHITSADALQILRFSAGLPASEGIGKAV